ncbi:LLM class flavin-dependent oxidoreductase [Oceanobacillus sp. FSL K6-2867]|uniref:LLM class flavin-dependent oxidoreductase n=1 Tax=Oceanobacillus sp. FSL K6-2867 TaxID=2954748 RepID=UPI0030D9170D
MTAKRIFLNAFDMNTPGHQSPGLWAHPDDQSHRYKDSEYWTNLAKTLEKGRFDAVFIADVLGTYDVYGNSRDAAVKNGVQSPVNDPFLIVPYMAAVTKHLGFGITASVTHEHPYTFARKISTLDHLTNGRIGWNIVTSYLKSAAINMGLEDQINHDERYNIADEYLEVCYKLWEESWEDDAVKLDKENRIYTDPNKVHNINHTGKYFKVPGAHLCEPSPQRTPVLYQAGASKKGSAFAANNAELVFIGAPTIETAKATVDKLRKDIEQAGRSKDEVKILTMFVPIVGKTEAEAKEKYNDYQQYISAEGALALFGGWTGVDLSTYEKDQKISYIENDSIRSALENFTRIHPDRPSTVEDVIQSIGIGGMGATAIGTPEQVADEMERWINEAGVDGFNIAYALTPGSFIDFVDLVVPVLQERGLVQTKYKGTTLRDNLFRKGDRLLNSHRGRQNHLLTNQ